MEQLLGETILKENRDAETEIVYKFKEFMLLFYGASWSVKSQEVAKKINNLLSMINLEDTSQPRHIEVFYLSNDRS